MPEMWGYLVFTNDGEAYPLPEMDDLKFALRRLYYREHAHCVAHGVYSADANGLLGDDARRFGLEAFVTPSLFEGVGRWKGEEWHIDQDGYLWRGDRSNGGE